MQEFVKVMFGIVFLIIGYFVGGFLARMTKEELASGKKWFGLIIVLSLVGVVSGLIMGDDVFLFTFAFIAVVTSRSMKYGKGK